MHNTVLVLNRGYLHPRDSAFDNAVVLFNCSRYHGFELLFIISASLLGCQAEIKFRKLVAAIWRIVSTGRSKVYLSAHLPSQKTTSRRFRNAFATLSVFLASAGMGRSTLSQPDFAMSRVYCSSKALFRAAGDLTLGDSSRRDDCPFRQNHLA
jgi:hypothetical protein